MAVSTGYCVCPKGACWCGRSAGGSPSPGCWSQCRGCAGCSSSSHDSWSRGGRHWSCWAAERTGNTGMLGWAHSTRISASWVGRGGTWPRSPSDSPLIELSTNLREDSVAGKVAGLYKEKAPIGAFSGHYETSRRFVDGSTLFTNQPWHNENAILYVLRDLTILGPF